MMNLKLVICIAAIIAAVGAYFLGRSDGRELERSSAREKALEHVADVRAEDKRRLDAQEKIANEAKEQRDKALADARAANAVSDRLRNSVASLTARINNSTASGDCQAAITTGLLFADLFRRADERAGELAEYADRARIAGQACESAYDSLR
ncbi:DUF2514 domain-containing protein [Oxalobacter sp. OttesenSCG-928-P03]|nr:DUF2514 domain-containing protein [Oxalobacter sp. OttesenSCG-928-P03]